MLCHKLRVLQTIFLKLDIAVFVMGSHLLLLTIMMIIIIDLRLCIKTKSIITKNDRQGGGGQFSSIHRRAAQAGSTLAQVMIVNISTQIIFQTWLKLYS